MILHKSNITISEAALTIKMKAKEIKSMFLAIQRDNFDQFQTYFEECTQFTDVNNLRNTSEDSAVHVAAQHGRLSILKYMLSRIP